MSVDRDDGLIGRMGGASGRLSFGLLGSVRAWCGDSELDLGSRQQRALLALLLLSDGKRLSVDDALYALWGVDVPRSAVVTVRTYISRLRRLLLPAENGKRAGRGLIVSEGGGYRLAVDADAVDVGVFRQSLTAAREARRCGDLAEALRQLRHGLSLWRGAPLANLYGPGFDGHRAWLEQLHSTANEERLSLDIELGNHAEAVAELTAGVAEQPYRERLWELLMLALYRSGRQAEALSMYREVEQLLRGEHGLGPGPGLRELHGRILASDPSLVETAAPRMDAHLRARPAQLPPDVGDFVGRSADIADITDHLLAGRRPSVVGLTGSFGMGKTALAIHAAHAVRSHFPDGQLYASLHTREDRPSDARDVLLAFLRALGVDNSRLGGSLWELTALWRTVLAGRRVLIVLDDAYDSDQVGPLLPVEPDSAAIVTGWQPLVHLPGIRSAKVGPLQQEEALELFATIAGKQRVDRELTAASRIVSRCSYHPLAVRVAANWVLSRPTRTVEQVEQQIYEELRQPVVVNADCVGDGRSGLQYRRVLTRLAPDLATAYKLMLVPDCARIDASAAAALFDISLTQATRTLEALVGTHLIELHADGTYYLPAVIKLIMRRYAQADEGVERCSDALDRLARYFLATARDAAAVIEDSGSLSQNSRRAMFPDSATARAWLSSWRTEVATTLTQLGNAQLSERKTDGYSSQLVAAHRGRLDHDRPDLREVHQYAQCH